MSSLLDNLNSSQQEAVLTDKGPLLIVAGAGTGKTTVLINRLANLVMENKVDPEKILITTFTDKAAGEMKERADRILPYGYFNLWIHTFHGLCERILRENGLEIGLDSGFKVLSETQAWILVKRNLELFNLDYYSPLGSPTRFIREMLKHFSRLKDENISPTKYLEYAEGLKADGDAMLSQDDEGQEMEKAKILELANAFHTYNKLLIDNNFLDFGDLIIYTLKLLKERPNILARYRHQFEYIMVDEFQDTNWAQYELVKLLAAPNNNLAVVGDDNQAIFRFRGASLSNIMQFKDDYPQAKEVVLSKNYRSGQKILDAAYRFIKHNDPNTLEAKLGISKELFSQSSEKGEILSWQFETVDDEVSYVADEMTKIKEENPEVLWSDFAVLIRSNSQADKFVKEFSRRGLPHVFYSLKGLYYKPIVLDCLAYLKLLDNYHESTALFRVLNMSSFKVSYPDLVSLNKLARRKNWSLFEALKNINANNDVSSETVKRVNFLLKLIEEHSLMAKNEAPSKIFVTFAHQSGLLKDLDHNRDAAQFSYLNQLYKKIKEFENGQPDLRLKGLMEIFDLEFEAGETGSLRLDFEDEEVIKIMTVHSSKGLEFRYVFSVDLNERSFPSTNRSEALPIPDELVNEEEISKGKEAHIEEERRLFYVAITRAKSRLYLCCAKDTGGVLEKKYSRFLAEAECEPQPFSIGKNESELMRDISRLESGEELSKDASPSLEIPKEFSFSQLAAYSSCPLQYKFAHILKVPTPMERDNFIFGRTIHDTLYDFLKPIADNNGFQADLFGGAKELNISQSIFSQKKLLEIYEGRWQSDGFSSAENRDKYQKKGKEILKSFHGAIDKLPDVLHLEKDFSFHFQDASFKGKIDRIDKGEKGWKIIDYKTGTGKEKLDYQSKRQLILYWLFVEEQLQQKVESLSFYYLETGEELSFLPTPKEVEKFKAEVSSFVSSVMARDFSPKPAEFTCKYCDFNGICEFRA